MMYVCMYVCAYTSIYAFSLVTYKYILSVICIHNTTHMIYSFIYTYIRTSPASSPARWRCSTTLANSPAFASQLERWMEACAWRQPSMSSSRCTLYNHHHYHHILQLPLLPPLACVVTTILLLPLPPKLSHIAWAVTTASTTTATTIITHLWLPGLVEIAVGVCSSADSFLRHIHATADGCHLHQTGPPPIAIKLFSIRNQYVMYVYWFVCIGLHSSLEWSIPMMRLTTRWLTTHTSHTHTTHYNSTKSNGTANGGNRFEGGSWCSY